MKNIQVMSDGSAALGWPDVVDARVLAVASTAEAHPVPEGASHVMFNATADFFVRYNTVAAASTAAVPVADVTNGSASELNPTVRFITGITEISLVSATAGAIVTMAFYRS